ncbi:hypothetical protein G6011_07800 [Alternaria panax]|uniref:RBR-type E3 ubiquitin transferase n=1 Tax=Alternaria panax TaxID=48097 RepID=A0AAD4F911_9PLEO|nr:hypothetical protein G6011_07800 [Alternaria panax]
MSKSCVICGTEESEGELLLEAPCGRHWVCADDVGSFFENATNNESLFPPQCCGTMFMLEDYEDHVPFETVWAYQMKQQGEYSILAKFRVYCANPPCGKFLYPGSHVEDSETKITYAICETEECGKLTCVKCKALLEEGTQNHQCKQTEDEKKFKQTAKEKGYQECFVCGATVELAEACNHITCDCGNSFCYVCGENWPGLHGCPHYGPAVYDEEGYNQDGYHRESGLNREGLTRRQEMIRHRGEEEDDEDDDDGEGGDGEGEDGEGADPEWEVLQHLTPDQRAMINQLPHGPREDALDQFRITLFETQGITFDQFVAEFGDDGDAVEDDDDEDPDEDQNEDPQLGDAPAGPTLDEALADNATDQFADVALAMAHGEDLIGVANGMIPHDTMGSVDHQSDEEDVPDALDNFMADEEGTQGDFFVDDQSEVSDLDMVTPQVHHNNESTDQRPGTASTASTDTDIHPQPATFPTDGPHTIVARGFVSGTTIQDVETIVSHHSNYDIVGRSLRRSDPLIVELQFATREAAEAVVAAFHGQKADGQVLDVRMEDEDL